MDMSRLWVSEKTINEKKKIEKKEELSDECTEHIYKGFSHTINNKDYCFNYDTNSQINFQDTMHLFEKNVINSVKWTAKLNEKDVRVDLNKKEFIDLYNKATLEKINKISHYRDTLEVLIDEAKTEEDIKNINWKSEFTKNNP